DIADSLIVGGSSALRVTRHALRKHAVQVGNLEVGFRDDREIRASALRLLDVLRPGLVIDGGVDRETDDLDVAALEFRLEFGHVAELGRADRGEVLGMREENSPTIPEIGVK